MHQTDSLQSHNQHPQPERNSSDEEPIVAVKQDSNMENKVNQEIQLSRNNKNAFVGTGFTIDITEFFKFDKKQQLQPDDSMQSIYKQIGNDTIAWIILLYSVLTASLITCWVLCSRINNFLALTWRFIFQFFLMIPFVLYERRTATPEKLRKYDLLYIFNTENLKKMYIYSLSGGLWYGVILTCGQWTHISQALYLGSVINFFTSLRRGRENVHKYELSGQIAVIIGIVFVLVNTYFFESNNSSQQHEGKITSYISEWRGLRLLVDIIVLLTSFVLSKITSITAGTPSLFPPYLSIMILNVMNAINMLGIGYFFNGVTFDFSAKWGFFSIITDVQFARFMYGCLILCLSLIITFVLIGKMFPNFVAPSSAYFLEPGISTIVLSIVNFQPLPGWVCLIGYVIMTPGMMLISLGRWMHIRRVHKQRLLLNAHQQLDDINEKDHPGASKSIDEQKQQK